MGILDLEYSVTHPYPWGRIFTIITYAIMIMILPVLIIINIVTVGYELVPSLQPDFAAPNSTIPFWPKSPRLPNFLTRTVPLCQPKDIGRGDQFRLSPSLFEYRVLSSWRTNSSKIMPQDEGRVEYRGGSFRKCSVYEMLFDHSSTNRVQTVTAGIMCPEYPVRLYMEARIALSLDVSKDIVGQYYGYDINSQRIANEDTRDYRQSVFGILDAMSTDSLGIILQQHLSAPLNSISVTGDVTSDTNITFHSGGTIVYQNGTVTELNRGNDLGEAELYRASITNIMIVVHHAVEVDLGNPSPGNMFTNPTFVNDTLAPNTAPARIDPLLWMGNRSSFAYGYVVPPLQTWAQMIRAGLPKGIPLGNLTGLPADSKMVTNYLCPVYRLKPTSTLLGNVFIGTTTMFLSVWAAWMTFSGVIARKKGCSYMACRYSNHKSTEGSDYCTCSNPRTPKQNVAAHSCRNSHGCASAPNVSPHETRGETNRGQMVEKEDPDLLVDGGIQELRRLSQPQGRL
ncbi:unnamed protein product [Rhizoctonia solani]|uniref:Transmembrane protein n=1 Tax=Rhizoctonia solani TaxID=456999 RepID=A0A8H3C1P3_9AGAM|nr:unnamed protein product [Rhizoctonia solani]